MTTMSTSNPSHLLLSRNPRSPAHPQLAHTSTPHFGNISPLPSPTILDPYGRHDESHRGRHSSVPNLHSSLEGVYETLGEDEEEEEIVVVHETFWRDSHLPGRVKVVVGRYEFWCHKEVLWFASPFFHELLQGSWAETRNTSSGMHATATSSSIGPVEVTSSPTDTDTLQTPAIQEETDDDDADDGNDIRRSVYLDAPEINIQQEPVQDLVPLDQSSRPRRSFSSVRASLRATAGRGEGHMDAVVELHEESAAAFQDFLFWCYPHLECKVTWTNVENLIALSSKLLVPALTKLCTHFLLTHCSGRPVMALQLAEEHANAELYREASRFVLDQPTWDPEEMEVLSPETMLKLSMRRNWFLERLLKLGTIDVKKEYTCRPDCPDSARCQAQLDEKWRQAHSAVCRYGPPQPSVAFRCLRQLETLPTNPSLMMPHSLCQAAAKSWVMTLFDRMFQPKVMLSSTNPGTEKYWLWISMN
ncbi:hypothetical protein BCR39DRAFT_519937 [Naematelia encephala]|uniref:BTB domain-containing protein n=1 Tax=Naematelia encephala TaxID=71784 RepID=A0A1Y2BF10_9TREE|nr:hypothetical protein BCR39DRAFT_519937 [Naematelia encephala]